MRKFRLLDRPTGIDAFFLSCLAVFITAHPFFLHGLRNFFELGIYLPGINAVLNGLVPYRDVFHLRGPLELYVPAGLMRIFGVNISVLEAYFYIGNVATLILFVMIGREMCRTRFVYYLLTPVLVARTFPRVAFTIWGGMRFALGALALMWAIVFFKRKKRLWIFLSGVASGLSFLTSIDTGVGAMASIFAALALVWILRRGERTSILHAGIGYALGCAAVLGSYAGYLATQGALGSWIDAMYSVTVIMTKVFPDALVTDHPSTLLDAISGLSPLSPYFKHLTPAYCYLTLLGWFFYRMRRGLARQVEGSWVCLFFYGLMLYVLAFRKLGSSVFEMALQPEKILLFLILESSLLYILEYRKRITAEFPIIRARPKLVRWKFWVMNFLILGLIGSSIGYSLARFQHRFFMFQYISRKMTGKETAGLKPLVGEAAVVMDLKRVRGMVLPESQAGDIHQLTAFFERATDPGEPVLLYPELGTYSFVIDRPFIGRFPMGSFAWFGRGWHEEFMADLRQTSPRFAVLPKKIAPHFEELYFQVPENRQKYHEVTEYVLGRYELVHSTPSLLIYQRKRDSKVGFR